VAVNLDGGQEFTAIVDGQLLDNIVASGDDVLITSGLADGEHTVELYRRVEAHGGVTTFRGFDFGGGTLLPPPVAPNRRVEVIGDSITCGYGNEGTNPCSFTYETENHYMTYEAIAARAVGAELHTEAWSGKGVVCNYGDDPCADPFPEYYDRTLPNDAASVWDFTRWQADVVVVNLGTNDVSTAVDPTDQEFQSAYVAFLTRIRAHYPGALILCTNGPMLGGDDLITVRGNIDAAIATLGDGNIKSFDIETQTGEVGCDYHPSIVIHQQVADVLVAQLQAELGW
jgi:lysophospholipase L1-like esterase